MANQRLLMALGKVIVAAAWADGKITEEEVNSLKDLLFRLPGMNAQDWAELDIYINSPISEAERERLVEDLLRAISSQQDKQLAIAYLDEVVYADGDLSEDENIVIGQIKQTIQQGTGGFFGALARMVGGAVNRRSDAVRHAPNREHYLEDFVKNRVYYALNRRMSSTQFALPEASLRKLSLAGGIMARVAHVDKAVTNEEFFIIVETLVSGWGLSKEEAMLVAEVAVSEVGKEMDFYRMTREFYAVCQPDDRVKFLVVLFKVAAADGFVTNDEIEEIRSISKGLILSHQEFIEAKLTIPSDQRAT